MSQGMLQAFVITLREGLEAFLIVAISIAYLRKSKRSELVPSLWSRYGHRVNLGLFFQVTAVFLFIFVVQLFIYGFHELAEANVFPYSAPLHEATEPYGPDGVYGHYLTYLLVLLPVGWLAFSSLIGGRKRMKPTS